MAIEIERKFLLNRTGFLASLTGSTLSQGYLNQSPDSTVRVRIADNKAWLTIKGRNVGTRRLEFEYPIPTADAQALLGLCQHGRIEKTRYCVEHEGNIWEIDVFHGDNDGLIVAEIELTDENETFARPDWLGEEVSDDPRYFNSALISHPFKDW